MSDPYCYASFMTEDSAPLHATITTLLGALRLGEPHMHRGIGLWPVLGPSRPEPVYLPLVEAQPLEGFQIREVDQDGSVPELRVVNETPHDVLLFDGEELKGAKQNRILNTSVLVAAGSSFHVPVSCTERGRWSYESDQFAPSGSLAYSQLRMAKSKDVAASLQAGVGHASNQGAVWEEIEKLHTCAESTHKSRTRDMRDAYRERQREIEEFVEEVTPVVGQCGLVAVSGERVEGIDVLSRPKA